MKKIIISSLIIVLTISLGLVISSFVYGDDGENGTESGGNFIIVRSTEINGMNPSSLIIIDEEGKTEEISLKGLKTRNMAENLSVIHAKLNEIKNKGYTLVSSNGGNSDNIICNTYIFEKR